MLSALNRIQDKQRQFGRRAKLSRVNLSIAQLGQLFVLKCLACDKKSGNERDIF